MQNPISKPVVAWDENDIVSLIANSVKENVSLDYKASAALQNTDGRKREISKDVSAFANSAGGILVYGVSEVDNQPTGIDGGVDPRTTTREWLEQVINSTIQPRIDGIRINPIDLVSTQPGNVIYVVEVPQAQTRGPHQASDYRYYKRFNFQSVAMEDYEVRDVMRRSSSPDLHILFALDSGAVLVRNDAPESQTNPFKGVLITPGITNMAAEPTRFAVIELYIDARLQLLVRDHTYEQRENMTLSHEGHDRYVTALSRNWGTDNMPLFSGPSFRLSDPLQLRFPEMNALSRGRFILGWNIQAPAMAARTGWVALDITPGYRISLTEVSSLGEFPEQRPW